MAARISDRDPSRTTGVRRAFLAEARRRLRDLLRILRAALRDDDAVSQRPAVLVNVRFSGDAAERLRQFKEWFSEQAKNVFLGLSRGGLWFTKYATDAFTLGVKRAKIEGDLAGLATDPLAALGTAGQWALTLLRGDKGRAALGVVLEKAKARMEDLVTKVVANATTAVSRLLGTTAAPSTVAAAAAAEVAKEDLALRRFVNATAVEGQARGQAAGMAALGVERVVVYVETAGDGNVCPECVSLSKKEYTPEAAAGLLPVHPECRCALRYSTRVARPKAPA